MEEAAAQLLMPVLEGAMVLAAHYCKKCGRSTVTAMDMQYGLKFAARNVLGHITESMFPELYDESESDESFEEVDEDDEPFTRYTSGPDEWCLKMNDAFDTWDAWNPEIPAEQVLKRAIDSRG